LKNLCGIPAGVAHFTWDGEVCIDTKKHGMRAICSSLAPRLVNAGRLRRIYCQPFEGDCIDRTGGTTGVRCNVMGIRSPLTTAMTA
jgi:hypothetical protein